MHKKLPQQLEAQMLLQLETLLVLLLSQDEEHLELIARTREKKCHEKQPIDKITGEDFKEEKRAHQQQSKHAHVHLATGYIVLELFQTLTTLRST